MKASIAARSLGLKAEIQAQILGIEIEDPERGLTESNQKRTPVDLSNPDASILVRAVVGCRTVVVPGFEMRHVVKVYVEDLLAWA